MGVVIIAKEPLLQRIEKMAEQRLTAIDIELIAVEYVKENKEQILRIIIDRESGVNLELCSEASRAIKDIIDEQEIFYDHLEVSSPGLDRELKKDKDFLRFSGHRIRIKTLKTFAGPRKTTGILKGFDELHLRVETENGEEIEVPRSMISRVRLDPDL